MPYLSVVVPAFNEENRLPRALEGIARYYSAQPYSFEVIVVSDGSKDRTEQIVLEFGESHPEFVLHAYQPNQGKGFAVRTGMLRARGELVLFCDADLATPPEETDKLLGHMKLGADVAIGSRPLRESELEKHQPWYREAFGRASNMVVQILAVPGIQDTQCGFKIYTQKASRDIFSRCKINGFSFDVESLMVARDLGYRIDEVPIRWADQEGSKVVLSRDAPRALRDIVKLRLMGKRRRIAISSRPAFGSEVKN